MSMPNNISWGSKDNEKECESNVNLVFLFSKKKLEQDNGHFLVLFQKTSGILSVQIVHKVNWTEWQRRRCFNLAKADIQSSVSRVQLSRGQLKNKSGGKLSIHYCADLDTIKTVFRTIIYVNHLNFYGAVAEMCEEYETLLGATSCGGTIEFLIRVKRDQDRSAFAL